MQIRAVIFATALISVMLVRGQQSPVVPPPDGPFTGRMTAGMAAYLVQFPLKCAEQPFPYKTGVSFGDSTFIRAPQEYHPAFFGCFDWHSSVHGHWMLLRLLRMFPELPRAGEIRGLFNRHFTESNIRRELDVFLSKDNRGFERTYGWAWLLTLQKELDGWSDPDARRWAKALQPLSDTIVSYTQAYLRKLVYPIRTGEHNNLAFGLSLMYDYAVGAGKSGLRTSIEQAAIGFYGKDAGCPFNWEPGGSDFLSPCLEEAALMRKVMPAADYKIWLRKFMPQLFSPEMKMETGKVLDRSDGKLVHLDGLNFSRSWCLYAIGKAIRNEQLLRLSDQHLKEAMEKISSGDYSGEHWLATFAVYAMTERK
jgi:hypothetical protein